MENDVKCAIAHFDKKVTDYQLYVNNELSKQSEEIKKHERYLINTLDSHKKLITDMNTKIGTIETELDSILAIQNELLGVSE